MKAEFVNEMFSLMEAHVESRPSPIEFEMAYQSRVAIDRIRFAIKHTEQFGPQTDQIREAGLQLLDALQRLEAVDRRFQERSRNSTNPGHVGACAQEGADGNGRRYSHGPTS